MDDLSNYNWSSEGVKSEMHRDEPSLSNTIRTLNCASSSGEGFIPTEISVIICKDNDIDLESDNTMKPSQLSNGNIDFTDKTLELEKNLTSSSKSGLLSYIKSGKLSVGDLEKMSRNELISLLYEAIESLIIYEEKIVKLEKDLKTVNSKRCRNPVKSKKKQTVEEASSLENETITDFIEDEQPNNTISTIESNIISDPNIINSSMMMMNPIKEEIIFESEKNTEEITIPTLVDSETALDKLKKNSDVAKVKIRRKKPTVLLKKQPNFTCKECYQVFHNKALYRKHKRTHSKEYPCNICGKILKSRDSLYHHKRGLHSTDKPYHCKECNKSFNFGNSYRLHIMKHKGERPYKCDVGLCNKTYSTYNHLKTHKEAVHEKGNKICWVCGKTFGYNHSLKIHLLTHESYRPHKCEKCGKGFFSTQVLKKHLLTHDTTQSFLCNICGKCFKSEASRAVHCQRKHYGGPDSESDKHICDVCGNKFVSKGSLKAHMATHNAERPFVCSICHKSFKTKGTLSTHGHIHKEGKEFECNICNKFFKTKSTLMAHEKKHNSVEKLECQQCGKQFIDSSGLLKHKKTVHLPKKFFVCTICGKQGPRADNMRTHIKSHRNVIDGNVNPDAYLRQETLDETVNTFKINLT